jgi:hypothetical protein
MKPSHFFRRLSLVVLLALGTSSQPLLAQTPTETSPPTVTITSPSQDVVLNSLPEARGTLQDEAGGSGPQRAALAINRTFDQVNAWWNGASWTPTFTELPATLNGNSWVVNTNLPGGADLIDGRYVLIGIGYDVAGNRSINARDTVIVVDTTAPASVKFTEPTEGQLLGKLATITGTVEDNPGGSGISRVDLSIRRTRDGRYWNGTDWVTTPTSLSTQSGGGFFTRNTGLPNGSFLASGAYTLTATAIDRGGNATSSSTSINVIADAIAPIINYTFPPNSAVLRNLPRVSGTVTDNAEGAGLDRVEFALLRDRDDRFWNGRSWQTDFFALSTTVSGDTWTRTSGLPFGPNLADGRYVLIGFAYDRVGNRGQRDTTFLIDTTAPRVLTFTSPVSGTRVGSLPSVSGTVADNLGGGGIQRVDLYIRRSTDGRYWSGSSWVSSLVALQTTLGNGTWTRSGGPGGINLPEAVYYLTAIAYDQAGNRTTRTGGVRVVDRVAPITIITAPATGVLQGSIPTIEGTLGDNPGGSGPDRVLVAIRRSTDNFYWTGSTWRSESATLNATLNSSGQWRLAVGLPSGNNVVRATYTVIAIGFDKAGNRSESRIAIPVIPDRTGPVIIVDNPREGSTVQSLTRVSGTVSDPESGVARVGVAILRNVDELWWNGRTWTDRFVTLPATVSGNTWTLTTNLPPSSQTPRGFYVVIAQAYNRVNTVSQIDRNIAIDQNAPAQRTVSSGLSTISANAASASVVLSFRTPLNATPLEVSQFNVSINGVAVEIESIAIDGANSVTLGLTEGSLPLGANVEVAWQGISAANGTVLQGSSTAVAK